MDFLVLWQWDAEADCKCYFRAGDPQLSKGRMGQRLGSPCAANLPEHHKSHPSSAFIIAHLGNPQGIQRRWLLTMICPLGTPRVDSAGAQVFNADQNHYWACEYLNFWVWLLESLIQWFWGEVWEIFLEIYLLGSPSYVEIQGIFHSLAYFSNDHKSWSLYQAKTRNKNSIWVSPEGARTQTHELLFCCFPRWTMGKHKLAGWDMKQLECETVL